MEFNKPVSNPMLIGSIQVMKAEPTTENKNMFVNELVNAKLLAPVIITPEPELNDKGEPVLTPENKIQFPMLTAPDGKHFFMAFTDKMELKSYKNGEETYTFALTIDDYTHMILTKESQAVGFVLNPYGDNIIIPREMLANILVNKMKAKGIPVPMPPAGFPGRPGAAQGQPMPQGQAAPKEQTEE